MLRFSDLVGVLFSAGLDSLDDICDFIFNHCSHIKAAHNGCERRESVRKCLKPREACRRTFHWDPGGGEGNGARGPASKAVLWGGPTCLLLWVGVVAALHWVVNLM